MEKRSKTAFLVLLFSAIGGIIFSFILYKESVNIAAGAGGSAACRIGEGFNCEEALSSAYNAFLGIPLPVLSAAFYFSIVALVIGVYGKLKEGDVARAGARYAFFTFAGAVAASAFLGYINFIQLESRCPYCIALYAVNLVGLGAAIMAGPKLKDFFSDLGDGVGDMFRVAGVSVVVLVLGVFIMSAAYEEGIKDKKAELQQADRAQGRADAEAIGDLRGGYSFNLQDLPRKGPADAAVEIVEFADLQCPACIQFRKTLQQVHEAYPDDVAIYFAHYPLSSSCNASVGVDMHPAACVGARVLVCAKDQGKFWEMHDDLFAFFETAVTANRKVEDLPDELITAFAQQRDLDAAALLACMKEPSTAQRVKDQIAQGDKAGLRATPSWFINGYKRSGGVRFEGMKPQIEKLLRIHAEQSGEAPTQP